MGLQNQPSECKKLPNFSSLLYHNLLFMLSTATKSSSPLQNVMYSTTLMQHRTRTLEYDLGSTTRHLCLALNRENTSEDRELCSVDHISRETLIDSEAL